MSGCALACSGCYLHASAAYAGDVHDQPGQDLIGHTFGLELPRDHLELSPRVARIEAHEPIQLNVRVDTPPQPFEFGLGL